MDDDDATGFAAAVDHVYALAPQDFVRVRSELAAAARSAGDTALARRIATVRKPTSAAAVVNRQVHADPAVTGRLVEIGDRLRAAQGTAASIDRDLLRELSLERRTLVRDLSADALATFAPSAGASVRDEVIATFDAAVADPEVAARLGRLTHAEQWSGLGVVADSPSLTVVPGGGAGSTSRSRSHGAAKQGGHGHARPAGERRRARELSTAEQTLSAAEHDLSAALDAELAVTTRVDELEGRVTALQAELGAAERDAKDARAAVRSARSRHRAAKSARDRVARRLDG